jgi:hypothetical protein
MKANELRIGNLIQCFGQPYNITIIGAGNVKMKLFNTKAHTDNVSIKDIVGIPLTEEWLLKFGFKNNTWEHKQGANTMYWDKVDCILHIGDQRDTNYSFMAECMYVNQLQNLYFALTGEELKIKELND